MEAFLEKNHFGPWDAKIFEVAPALLSHRSKDGQEEAEEGR